MIIELPHVGESVTEGTIVRWLKLPGERVERYDPLVEVLTDKVSMEMPSPVAGVLTEHIAGEGETVPFGAPIADIQIDAAAHADTAGNTAPPASPQQGAEDIGRTGVLLKDVAPVGPTGSGALESAEAGAETAQRHAASEPPPPVRRSRRRYSPAVMRLANEHSIDLSQLTGSGLGGRITRKDVLAAVDAETPDAGAFTIPTPAQPAPHADAPPDEERLELTPLRRVIAANMVRSASEIPSAWSITEVDVSGLVRRRNAVRDAFQRREGVNLTYLSFVVKAVAESLKENPLLNSSWADDAIILKRRINIGIAVAAAGGLVVPVLRDADTLSIAGIAKRAAELTARARQGNLTIDDVQGGTFTLNNTGALGSVASQPIINHPQAAILTTEAVVKRPVVIGEGIAIRSMMNICLTFDHRIIDGAEASAFSNAVKRRLEAVGEDTPIY